MSYSIVKTIKIIDDKVYVRACDNNVSPKHYDLSERPYLTNILQTQGRDSLDIAILRAYEEGNFQPGTQNRYTRALKYLHSRPEYATYDWRLTNVDGVEYETLRNSNAFADLLHTSLYIA